MLTFDNLRLEMNSSPVRQESAAYFLWDDFLNILENNIYSELDKIN